MAPGGGSVLGLGGGNTREPLDLKGMLSSTSCWPRPPGSAAPIPSMPCRRALGFKTPTLLVA